MLVDVFATDSSPLSREALELPLLFSDAHPHPVLFSTTLTQFYNRLDAFSGELIQELKRKSIPGLVIAGGAVIGALTGLYTLYTRSVTESLFRSPLRVPCQAVRQVTLTYS